MIIIRILEDPCPSTGKITEWSYESWKNPGFQDCCTCIFRIITKSEARVINKGSIEVECPYLPELAKEKQLERERVDKERLSH